MQFRVTVATAARGRPDQGQDRHKRDHASNRAHSVEIGGLALQRRSRLSAGAGAVAVAVQLTCLRYVGAWYIASTWLRTVPSCTAHATRLDFDDSSTNIPSWTED